MSIKAKILSLFIEELFLLINIYQTFFLNLKMSYYINSSDGVDDDVVVGGMNHIALNLLVGHYHALVGALTVEEECGILK